MTTVSGVERSRPTGPQSQVQKTADTSKRHHRQPGRGAVEDRLHDVVGEQFDDQEHRDDSNSDGESVIGGNGQRDRERRRHPRADVGDESKHCAEQSPKQEAGESHPTAERQPYQPQPQHRQAVGAVDDRLGTDVADDPVDTVIDCGGRERVLAVADESNGAVADVLAFEQDEEDEYDHEARGRQWRQRDADIARKSPQRRRLPRHDVGVQRILPRAGRLIDLGVGRLGRRGGVGTNRYAVRDRKSGLRRGLRGRLRCRLCRRLVGRCGGLDFCRVDSTLSITPGPVPRSVETFRTISPWYFSRSDASVYTWFPTR